MDFVHLHAHSSFSLLQGAMRPQELVEAAAAMGLPAVALTDTNGLYGAIVFYQAARAAGIKPIVGAEIVYGPEQAVLLAADRQGYANLCRIVTERRLFGTVHEDDFRGEDDARAEEARQGSPQSPPHGGRHIDSRGCQPPEPDASAGGEPAVRRAAYPHRAAMPPPAGAQPFRGHIPRAYARGYSYSAPSGGSTAGTTAEPPPPGLRSPQGGSAKQAKARTRQHRGETEFEGNAAAVCRSIRIPHSAIRNPFDLARSIARDPQGLIVLTASPSLLRRLAGVLAPGRLYAELRVDEPHSFETRCPAICGMQNAPRDPAAALIADLAERLGVPLAATVNANFLTAEDRATHAVLSAIRENVPVKALAEGGSLEGGPPVGELAGPHSYYMTPEEVACRLPASVRREAMANTCRIAEECNLELEFRVPHFPRADLAPGQSAGPEHRRRACEKLRAVAYEGARRRYGGRLDSGGRLSRQVRERLERELGVIAQLDFCDYFLVVRDIVEFAEREGIPHVGRGSAANSIVSYCLGISAVCPLKFDLYFERFLNEFRTDVPDIDIDFCWRRRDDVINYVYGRYGAQRVAMVSTHSTLQARSAFRDVGRVMGLPLDEVSAYSKLLPHYGATSIEEAMGMFPEMAGFPIDREPWRSVVRTALKVDGYVRHLSIHLGGLVIGDRPLTWYTALENSAKGIVVTQYEMDSIEETGLVKIDLLGQRSLSIVAEAARNIEEQRGIRVDLDHLPDGDRRTAALLKRGRTMGCFQIESPGMRHLLQMQQAKDIMDLIQGLSLIRPGPSSSGMKHAFIRRRRGEEPVPWPTPLLKEALGKTYGVMLYQEDILRVAQAVAGFSLAEGDELRKLISKSRSREKMEELRGKFVEGAAARGVEAAVAGEIWDRIEDFAAYSYCKAHATTYGHISWQAAYLKAHWPAEFLASVIANKAGFYDPRTYFEDARRFNVRILAPDVNRSEIETKPENGFWFPVPAEAGKPGSWSRQRPAQTESPRHTAGGQGCSIRNPQSAIRNSPGAIRPGLEFVKSLSAGTIRQILEQRLHGDFVSLEDFCARMWSACDRVRPSRQELENLILCGAFDSLGENRPTLLMKMERLLKRRCHSEARFPGAEESLSQGRRRPHDRDSSPCRRGAQNDNVSFAAISSQSLFEHEPPYAAPVPVPPQPPYPLAERVLWELRILGFSHSGHPLDAWDGRLRRMAGTPSYEIARHIGRTITFVGWLVTLRRAVTRRHDYMEFLTLEDRHGVVEAVLFPDVYRRYGAQVTEAGCYKVVGKVDEEHGAVNLVAESVEAVPLP